ncbi:MAG: hydrogenase nickel incorporation protein HypB [Helicobacteraceae bacterium]|jgi:hydrogenase nickel incorporation protein HypB|nr:hydrogenase nickel incorporation protein HypB [Helicobacteraceae bacterium]
MQTILENPNLNAPKTIEIMRRVLAKNDDKAAQNRALFDDMGILALNLMSSPGSGKTTLLEATARSARFKFAVIEGDLETNRDAERLQRAGIAARQIVTGTACHLEADMVQKAIAALGIDGIDALIVENVGNLVCPADYALGTHLNIVLLSTPEGDDKVLKYPVMFRAADLVIITKAELASLFDFSLDRARDEARQLKPEIKTIALSAKTGEGMSEWLDFVDNAIKRVKK